MIWLKEKPEGLMFKIFVQPRASRNEFAGVSEDAVKIKLTAPPVDDAANKMLIKFLAKTLGVSKSSLTIARGRSSRRKTVLLAHSARGKTETGRFKGLILSLIKT